MLGREEFYNVTKLLHNALQGNPQGLSPEEWQVFAKYNEMNARELTDGLGRDHRPRPPAGRDPPARAGQGRELDLALPHRPVHAEPDAIERLVPLLRSYDGAVFHLRDYVPAGLDGGAGPHLPAGDRPAVAEEHGLLARGRRVRLRPVRHRRRPAADVPGLALRPLEGPDGRDRRLPQRQGGAARRPARAGRLDGHRRPRGLGVLQLDDGLRRRATPTSTSSTTSTTSGRSR